MFEIVIVDENYDALVNIFNILKKYDIYKVKSIYGDARSAKDFIINQNQDILIINYNKEPNVYKLIKDIRDKKLNIKILLIIERTDDMDKFIKNNIDIDEVLMKNFNEEKLIQKLEKISMVIPKRDEIVNKRIEKILRKFNFNKTSRGYYYIVDSLNYCITREYDYISKFYEVCVGVSNINKNCTHKQVLWDMTKTIKSMTRLTDNEILEKYFPFNPNLTTKSFLNEILGIYYTIYRNC